MLLPSKELLSEVLRVNVKFIEFDIETIKRRIHGSVRDNDIYYHDGKLKFINIYELAHKCKEWAYSKGYDIYSDYNGADVCNICSNYSIAPFHHNVTEKEAIFKACEWIMEKTKC